MKPHELDKNLRRIRNIGLFAHIDAGKTTTTERILYYTGKSYKMGEVHDGEAIMDWMEQEQERGITITAAATTCFWKEHRVNLIDTPGHVDFTVEVERSLRVLDGAIIVFDSTKGVEPQSESVWWKANKHKVPRIGFINKMDRVSAHFKESLVSIQKRLNTVPLPLQIPLSQEAGEGNKSEDFYGVIDIVEEKAYQWDSNNLGETFVEIEIPKDCVKKMEDYREALLEKVSEFDDKLMEKYLEGEKILSSDLRGAIRKGTLELKITPIFCGTALKNKAIQPLLDAVLYYLPSPLDLPLLVGKSLEKSEKSPKDVICKIDPNEPVVAFAFKVAFDPFMGTLVYVRVYSGCLSINSKLLNSRCGKKEKIQKILRMHANHREEVKELKAGDIGSVIGLKFTKTGDTLCDKSKPLSLEPIHFPQPVISIAIEAKSMAEREKMFKALDLLQQEDPSCSVKIDSETGQTLLCGMGELHLEVLLERLLREHQLKINAGHPQVAYRETIMKVSQGESVFEKDIAGQQNFVKCELRLEPQSVKNKKKGLFKSVSFSENLASLSTSSLLQVSSSSSSSSSSASSSVSSASSSPSSYASEHLKIIDIGIREASEVGLLMGSPLIYVHIEVVKLEILSHKISEVALKSVAFNAFKEALKRNESCILEPIFKVEINAPEAYTSAIVGDFNSKRGKVIQISPQEESAHSLYKIVAEVPLSSLISYATRLRSLSQGRAVFNMEFKDYSKLPPKEEQELLKKVGFVSNTV